MFWSKPKKGMMTCGVGRLAHLFGLKGHPGMRVRIRMAEGWFAGCVREFSRKRGYLIVLDEVPNQDSYSKWFKGKELDWRLYYECWELL